MEFTPPSVFSVSNLTKEECKSIIINRIKSRIKEGYTYIDAINDEFVRFESGQISVYELEQLLNDKSYNLQNLYSITYSEDFKALIEIN